MHPIRNCGAVERVPGRGQSALQTRGIRRDAVGGRVHLESHHRQHRTVGRQRK